MKATLLNFRMHDGSRQFAELPEVCSGRDFRRHIERLSGATVTKFLTDDVTEMWLDFSFRSHVFTVNNQQGDFWFFVGMERWEPTIEALRKLDPTITAKAQKLADSRKSLKTK